MELFFCFLEEVAVGAVAARFMKDTDEKGERGNPFFISGNFVEIIKIFPGI